MDYLKDMRCNKCNNDGSDYRDILITGPEVLVIILNRGKGKEFDIKLLFTEFLDLTNYIENKNTGTYYKLTGVVTHIGDSSMSGHFIAFCKDPINGKWNKYNDAFVTEVTNFQEEVLDFGMPYILFYQKVR